MATPATWRLLLEADWAGHQDFAILCGGEPLPSDLAIQLLPRCGALWNVYGPTETTVWSTIARVEQSADSYDRIDEEPAERGLGRRHSACS